MLPIKLSFNKEVRRITLNQNSPDSKLSYQGLLTTAYTLFPSLVDKSLTFLWCDDESDIVCCSTDKEVEEALRVMKLEKKTTFKFDVAVASNSNPNPRVNTEVHDRVTCDGCGLNPIVGVRFKCTVREDFDLCERCEASDLQPYPMIKIYNPRQRPELILVAINDQEPSCPVGKPVRCRCSQGMEKLTSRPPAYRGGAFCDSCRIAIKYEDGFHHCSTCGYDLCIGCSMLDAAHRGAPHLRRQSGRHAWQHGGPHGFGGHGPHGRPFPGAGAGHFGSGSPNQFSGAPGGPHGGPGCGRRFGGCRRMGGNQSHGYAADAGACFLNGLQSQGKSIVEQLKANSHPLASLAEEFVNMFDGHVGEKSHPASSAAPAGVSTGHAAAAVAAAPVASASASAAQTEDELEQQLLEAVMRESLSEEVVGPPATTEEDTQTPVAVNATLVDNGLSATLSADNVSDSQSQILLSSVAGPSMRFVEDVTFPDSSVVLPGSVLNKVWRIKNDGVVAWPVGVKLAAFGGDNLVEGGQTFVVPTTVSPGEEIEAGVVLTAPLHVGRYVAYFKLTTPLGDTFGQRLWADFNVVEEEDQGWDVVVGNSSVVTPPACESESSAAAMTSAVANVVVEDVVVGEVVSDHDEDEGRADEVSRDALSVYESKYGRELFALREMGFSDLATVIPLLQRHIPDIPMSGAERLDCLQHVIVTLLSQSGAFNF